MRHFALRTLPIPGILLALGLLFTFSACSSPAALKAADERFVHAYTAGAVSVSDPIKVEFVEAIKGTVDEGRFFDSALRFEPAISGKYSWEDDNVLVFTPDAALPRETRYTAHFSADALKAVHPRAADFDFSFKTMRQGFDIAVQQPRSDDEGAGVSIEGTLTAHDTDKNESFERVVSLNLDGRAISLSWQHDGLTHRFSAKDIKRGSSLSNLKVNWDGSAVASPQKGEKSFALPAAGTFALIGVEAVAAEDSYIDVAFSDPLDPQQDLSGLIRFVDDKGSTQKIQVAREGSKVKLYSRSGWSGSGTVKIDENLRSAKSKRLVASQSSAVSFPGQKPAIRFAGSGVIIPTTQGLTIPIETMNLKYAMIEATRVYQDNIPQFLQVNDLEGTRELYRVGKIVWRQVVDLSWKDDNLDKWVRYGLDLTKLMKANPDGLFRLRITFRRPHIVWNMPAEYSANPTPDPNSPELKWGNDQMSETGDSESSYWDYYSDEGDSEQYPDYDNRNDPTDPAYYYQGWNQNVEKSRNFMISDIGLSAKSGTDGSLYVAATDLRSAKPQANVALSVLDFTRQTLATAVTDSQGFARFSAIRDKPYFVIGTANKQFAYLKLGDSDALSVSHFDIAGDTVAAGVKGFIYGERGVWRPGDTMFLNFILWDPQRNIPAEHPVSLELYNPLGQLVTSKTTTKATDGFYSFPIATADDAPTGNWLARVRLGGRTFEKTLKVETVMPNRLKIDFALSDPTTGVTNSVVKAKITSAWLTGIKAPGLRTTVEASLSPTTTSFANYRGYTFDDPARPFASEKQTIYDGNLDQNGVAEFSSNFGMEGYAPGKLRINFDTRVYESGGAFSSDVFSADYHPYPRYVGVMAPPGDVARGMLLTDTDHPIKIAVVDPSGKPVQSAQLRFEVYKLEWRWWWEGAEDSETMAQFISSDSKVRIRSETLTAKNGVAETKFRVNYPEWGRYLIRVSDLQGGHSTGIIKYVDWPGWAARQQGGPDGASVLVLSTDKTNYAVGDTVTVNVPGNAEGRGLVSLERAGKIIRQEWLQPTGASTQYKFTATPDMSPNIYVHVTFLQPHLQTANDVPIRTYGIVPVMVENPASHLKPVVVSDDVFKPGTTVKVKVSEQSGKAMSYTLAMVDEGLLGLTRFSAQDPWGTFYKREASLLKSWDLYDFVAGAFTARLENMLAIGGGDDGNAAGKRKPNRFPPMVKFIGPVTLAAGATNEHSFDMPEYVGAVRLMVVAASQPDLPASSGTAASNTSVAANFPAYGTAEKTVTVKKEVMVLGTLPRVMAPAEEAQVPVSVFYLGDGAKDVPVSIDVGGQISLVGDAKQTVRFKEPGEQVINFRIKAKDVIGTGNVKLTAQGAVDSATQNVAFEIRMPSNSVTRVYAPTADGDGVVKGGNSWSPDGLSMPGVSGTNYARLEVSTIPPLDLARRLDYLIHYPYGCIEQTVSSIFPQLFLPDLVDLSADKKAEVQKNVSAGIERLKSFQTGTGGFTYWPGEDSWISNWGTNYAGHFLLEAKRAGYSVPASMLNGWRSYQQQAANSWNDFSTPATIEQAYRLYTLALDGSADLAALNRLRERSNLPDQAKWRLAAAYVLVGQTPAATALIAKVPTAVKPYQELGGNFGSELRDKAMVLETMALMNLMGQALPLVKDISAELAKDQWLSTQETAYSLIAISKVANYVAGTGSIKTSYTVNGQKRTLSSTKTVATDDIPLGVLSGALKFDFKNEGNSPVFTRLMLTGTPVLGTEKASNQTLKLTVRYLDANGKQLPALDALTSGDDVFVELNVQNLSTTQKLEQLALTHQIASGFEIINSRMSAARQDTSSDQDAKENGPGVKYFDYQDIRDDRVNTFFALAPLTQKTFKVQLNAAYRGKFYLPSIKVEAMYDNSIQALVPGQWISIGERGSAGSTTKTTGGGR